MSSYTLRKLVGSLRRAHFTKASVNSLFRGRYFTTSSRSRMSTSSATQDGAEDEIILRELDGRHEGVTVLALNRPHAKNAISKNFLNMFEDHIQYLHGSRSTRVVILASSTPGCFCAGADLKERIKMKEEDVPLFVARARAAVQRFHDLPIPTIAAIDGPALGGGLEIALACDFRVVSWDARVGLVETKLAIIPGAGGTQRLPRLVGISAAKRLIYTGKALSGREAEAVGIAEYSVEQNEEKNAAYCKALELSEEILPQGPIALRLAKQAINHGMEVDLQSGLKYEELCYAQVIGTQDRIEGLKAFKEKRKPQYIGK